MYLQKELKDLRVFMASDEPKESMGYTLDEAPPNIKWFADQLVRIINYQNKEANCTLMEGYQIAIKYLSIEYFKEEEKP